MSIISIRSMFEKRWFQAVMIFLSVAFIMAMLIPSLFGSSMQQQRNQDPPLFVVGGREVKSEEFNQAVQAQQTRFGDAVDPDIKLQVIGGAIDAFITRSAVNMVAQKYGAKSTEEQLKKWAMEDVDGQMLQLQMSLMQAQVLKSFDQKEFEEYFKKQNKGKTLAEAKQDIAKELDAKLKDGESRKAIEEQYIARAAAEAAAAKLTVSDDELKANYDSFKYHRLSCVDPALTPEQREKAAEKAREDIAAGKPIADVYKALMKTAILPPTDSPRTALETDPNQKIVLTLKDGECSPVVQQFGNPTFYYLVKKENKLPENFEKEKAKLLSNFRMTKANTQVADEIKETKKQVKFDWKIPSLQMIHKVYLAKTEPIGKTTADYEALLKEAEALEEDNEYKAIAVYSAFTEVFNKSTAEQQKELKSRKAEVLARVLTDFDSPALRMELVDLYVELGAKEEAADALHEAAMAIVAFDPQTVADAGRIELKATQLQNSKTLTKEQADEVRGAIASWRKEKSEIEKEEAELKKQAAEEDKKRLAEDKKRAEEEQKELDAEAKKEADKKAAEAAKGGAKPAAGAPPAAPAKGK